MKDHFQKLRNNLEMSDTFKDIIQARHAAIRSVIENNLPTIAETKLIGSLQRFTRIQPRQEDIFDIDILVVLGEFTGWAEKGVGISATDALGNVHTAAKESDRYAAKNPQMDAPTITLYFADNVKAELVPAYIDNIGMTPRGILTSPKGRGYWVPKNGQWEHADYDFEADYISKQNMISDGWLVPSIKMLKAIRREYFPALGSFPLEIIASQVIPPIISARKRHKLQIDSPELLGSFFAIGKEIITPSLKIPGSNSPVVTIDTRTVESIKSTFGTIERYIKDINNSGTQEAKVYGWRKLFGDTFPAHI